MTPVDIDRSAPVVAATRREIPAPLDRVWALHVDVAGWPRWQHDIAAARLDGEFEAGATFEWTSAGLDTPVVSTVYEVEAGRTTLWGGPSSGITGIHRWTFSPSPAGTLVETEESWSGEPVAADVPEAQRMLEQSLERWLDALAHAAARP